MKFIVKTLCWSVLFLSGRLLASEVPAYCQLDKENPLITTESDCQRLGESNSIVSFAEKYYADAIQKEFKKNSKRS